MVPVLVHVLVLILDMPTGIFATMLASIITVQVNAFASIRSYLVQVPGQLLYQLTELMHYTRTSNTHFTCAKTKLGRGETQ